MNASIWVWFLPRSIAHCAEWKAEGIAKGNSQIRGYITMGMCFVMVAYGFICAILLLDPKTSCMKLVGGMGCPASKVVLPGYGDGARSLHIDSEIQGALSHGA